jgi:dihydropteroate synthase
MTHLAVEPLASAVISTKKSFILSQSLTSLLVNIGKLLVTSKSTVKIMGIINVSPESFYKNSIRTKASDIAKSAASIEQEGAHLVDIGAMSTAPYIENSISIERETERMLRAIKIVRKNCSLPISIDTPRWSVAREAVNLGIDCINDITGLKYDEDMARLVAESKLPVIIGAYDKSKRAGLRSKLGTTGKVSRTINLLKESLRIARRSGIKDNKIVIDPSIGFFRTDGKNPFFTLMSGTPWYLRDIEMISRLHELKARFSYPICISVSRKSFIGKLLNLETKERLLPSLALEMISALNGAKIIRTHSVRETFQALRECELTR